MKKVAIIGSGSCRLPISRSFLQVKIKGAKIPEINCFKKQDDCGGLWNYKKNDQNT